MISLFIEVLSQFVGLNALSDEPLLATLYGGVSVGVGIGLIFKGGGSAGGGTIIARIITSKTSLKTATVILILDSIVIVAAGFVFNNVEMALWSMISIFTTTKMIDVVLSGRPNERIVHISSPNNLGGIGLLINEKIGLNGTFIKAKNLNLAEDRYIIFVMVPANRLSLLKQIIQEEDSAAKMIMIDATQMLGTKFIN